MASATNEAKQFVANGKKAGQTYEEIAASMKATSASAGLAAAATNILNAALTSIAFFAIAAGVSFLVKKLDEFIRREEIAAEKAQEARDKIDGLKKTFSDNEKTVNSLKKRYAELAQGVSNLGTAFQNQGKLSTEEYEEFLDISTQLSNIFPTLTQGYDDNGQAILGLSGNVDTIVSSLDALIDRSRQIARMEIDAEMGAVWEDDLKSIANYNLEISNVEEQFEKISDGVYKVSNDDTGYEAKLQMYTRFLELANHSGTKNLKIGIDLNDQEVEELKSALDAIGFTGKNGNADWKIATNADSTWSGNPTLFNFGKIGPEKSDELRRYFQEQVNEYQALIHQTEDKIAQIHNRMQSNLIDYLSGDTVYLALDDNSKKLANEILNNLDVSEVLNNAENNIESWDDLTRWYQKNIIQAIADIDDKAIQGKMASILSGSVAPEDAERFYQEIIAYLQEALGADSKLVVYWKLQFEGYQDSNEEIYDKLFSNKAFQDYLTGNGSFSINNPDVQAERQRYEDWIKSLTDEEKELVLNADTRPLSYALSDVEAWLDKLKKKGSEVSKEVDANISESIRDVNEQLDPFFNSLADLYTVLFEDGVFDFEKIDISKLATLEQQFNNIADELQADLGDAFDASIVEKFFSDIKNASNTEEAQQAVNDFATAWFYNTEVMKDLNPETEKYIKRMMELTGITNADVIVAQARNDALAQEALGEDYASTMTAKHIQTILDENSASAALRVTILQAYAAENIFANADLNTTQKINELVDLAGQFLAVADSAQIAAYAAEQMRRVEEDGLKEETALANIKKYTAEFKPTQVEVEWQKYNQDDHGAGDAGKEEADEYLEAFNAELENLEWLHDNGYLNEKEYLDQLRILYERYFKDNDKYAKEFYENQRKYLEGLKDLYDSVLSAITDMLDEEIEKIDELEEKEKDEVEEQKKANDKKAKAIEKVNKDLDKQIKALEKEQKAIQKQNIDPIEDRIKGQEEIKKSLEEELSIMQKQNDERESAINLQKAEWELEKARNQRNILVDICQTL